MRYFGNVSMKEFFLTEEHHMVTNLKFLDAISASMSEKISETAVHLM